MATVGNEKFGDFTLEIEVSPSSGKFMTEHEDLGQFDDTTLDGLRDKIRRAVASKKKTKPVPISIVGVRWGKENNHAWTKEHLITQLDSSIDAEYRGDNARSGANLLTVQGNKFQAASYEMRDGVLTRRLTPAEHKQYQALAKTVLAAQADLDKFVEAVTFDLKKKGGDE